VPGYTPSTAAVTLPCVGRAGSLAAGRRGL